VHLAGFYYKNILNVATVTRTMCTLEHTRHSLWNGKPYALYDTVMRLTQSPSAGATAEAGDTA
jgi:hypothetical protein